MKKLILIFAIFLSSCSYVDRGYLKTSDSFMQQIQEGEIERAYKAIFAYEPLDPGVLNGLVGRTNTHLRRVGKIHNFEKAEEDKISSRLVKVVYISHHDLAPTKWDFYFFKSPAGQWHALNLKIEDKVENF